MTVILRSFAASLATLALAAACGGATASAGAASRATTSSNWSGYAVTGTSFQRVSAAWRVPAVDCSAGEGYSASWVGLGGYSTTSQALEQTGTEADCDAAGHASYSAWWELVPDAVQTVRLTLHAGDRIAASVEVAGKRVTMRLADTTRGTTYKRILTARVVDVSSAEWILEAPEGCAGERARALRHPRQQDAARRP